MVTRAGKNITTSFIFLFHNLRVIGTVVIIAGFLVATFSTVIRKYAQDKDENHILWGFFSSVILFLLLCLFKKDFVSIPVFYLSMGFWGFALGFINLVRGLKKARI